MIVDSTEIGAAAQAHNKPAPRLRRLLQQYLRWREQRKSAELLRSYPDYLLRDIGLLRIEVNSAVRGRYQSYQAEATVSRNVD